MKFSKFSSKILIATTDDLKKMYNNQDWFIITDILQDNNRTNGMVKRLENITGIKNFYFKDLADLIQINKILKKNKIGYWK